MTGKTIQGDRIGMLARPIDTRHSWKRPLLTGRTGHGEPDGTIIRRCA